MKKTFFILPLLFFCCKSESNKISKSKGLSAAALLSFIQYDDGIYCTEVSFINPLNDKDTTFKIPISIKDEKIDKVIWNHSTNYQDLSPFEKEYVEDAEVEITTEKGIEYTFELINQENCEQFFKN